MVTLAKTLKMCNLPAQAKCALSRQCVDEIKAYWGFNCPWKRHQHAKNCQNATFTLRDYLEFFPKWWLGSWFPILLMKLILSIRLSSSSKSDFANVIFFAPFLFWMLKLGKLLVKLIWQELGARKKYEKIITFKFTDSLIASLKEIVFLHIQGVFLTGTPLKS